MAIKRVREDGEMQSLDMAKCLMLLSYGFQNGSAKPSKIDDAFECKTCNRKFPSFQALGGHRASHKRPRLMEKSDGDATKISNLATKSKKHECSICGQEFELGQALGGHMRRHRAAMFTESLASVPVVPKLPVLRRSNSSRRVFGLDLNLTPLENDLEFLFGKRAPKVGNFV